MTSCIDVVKQVASGIYIGCGQVYAAVSGRLYAAFNDVKNWFESTAVVCKFADNFFSARKECFDVAAPDEVKPFKEMLVQVKYWNAVTSLPSLVDLVSEKVGNCVFGTGVFSVGARVGEGISAVGLGSGVLSKVNDVVSPFFDSIKEFAKGFGGDFDVGLARDLNMKNLLTGSVVRGFSSVERVLSWSSGCQLLADNVADFKSGVSNLLKAGDCLGTGVFAFSVISGGYSAQFKALATLGASSCKLGEWSVKNYY